MISSTCHPLQVAQKGFEVVGWRDVPQQKQVLGPMALAALPVIRQVRDSDLSSSCITRSSFAVVTRCIPWFVHVFTTRHEKPRATSV